MLNEGSNWQIDVHTQLHKRLLSQEMWRWITDDDHRGTPPPNLVSKVNRFCTLRHMYTSVALGKTLQDDVHLSHVQSTTTTTKHVCTHTRISAG